MAGGSGGSASGRLVVLDRAGRPGKAFPLATGAATIGRALSCDVRVLLPSVEPHHASLLVHRNQVLIRDEGSGATQVNGGAVSVAALQHGDVISVGGRRLRWEYDNPRAVRPLASHTALYKPVRAGRSMRRASASARHDAPPHRALLAHRASMPANAGGKQVAIVQPQRRDTSEQIEPLARCTGAARGFSSCPADTTVATLWIESRKPPASPRDARKASPRKTPEPRKSSPRKPASPSARKTPRKSSVQAGSSSELRKSSRASAEAASSPGGLAEARKSPRTPAAARIPRPRAASARYNTPLRVAVLRQARSAHKNKVTKIEAPLKLDHMKQAALLLMAGRSPRVSLGSLGSFGSFGSLGSLSSLALSPGGPARQRAPNKRGSKRSTANRKSSRGSTVSLVEITDTSVRDSPGRADFVAASPLLPSPKKSALKDPKRSSRKTESIKFDFSNLESYSSQDEDELMETGRSSVRSSTSSIRSTRSAHSSPSPRPPLHAQSSPGGTAHTPPHSPSARKSLRGSTVAQTTLEHAKDDARRRSTRTLTDNSFDATAETAFMTRTLSPRSARNLESYSIVDLVSSRDSNNDSVESASVYSSAGSARASSAAFGSPAPAGASTPRASMPRTGARTPHTGASMPRARARSSPAVGTASPNKSARRSGTRRSKSLTTPENSEETQKHISINSTRISRASKSRSRLNDSDSFIATAAADGDESPRTSRRNTTANLSHAIGSLSPKKASPSLLARTSSPIISSPKRSTRTSSPKVPHSNRASPRTSDSKQSSPRRSGSKQSTPKTSPKRATPISSPKTSPRNKRGSRSNLSDDTYVSSEEEGTVTPENVITLQEQGTPVLSIQSLLNSSQSSFASQKSPKSKASRNSKRKTIGTVRSDKKGRRSSPKSKSFTASTRRSLRALRLNSRESDRINESVLSNDEENVTPKTGGVKLVQEAVKNKHSTAKKPQSKRSIIDNLNDSDIVKQLFNSPVKRKLSQSMTEFSRKKLFEEESVSRRPARRTMFARTPDLSLADRSDRISPDRFVSPLGTPAGSPELPGIKRLSTRNSPRDDLTDVAGVRGPVRSPRTRKSVKNDLTNVSGVKNLLRTRKSARNDLTNVSGVKDVFAASPRNDLRRVSGVRSLFKRQKERASPRNDLSDVRGVKSLFTRKSPTNDLRNVSGVKKTMAKSPRNDLRDVRGVKRMLRQDRSRRDDSPELSGVEELFNESNVSSASHRDSEALFDQLIGKPPIKAVYSKSFLTKRPRPGKISRRARSLRDSIDLITSNVEQWLERELNKHLHKDQNASKASRALQQLATDTVEGSAPIRASRIRNSSANKSQLNVTEKKKSASELYSSHMLPLKKRSLERDGRARLPLKKRVLHSTPVRARASLAMDASELGRVSPITSDRTLAIDRTDLNRSKQTTASPKARSKHASKVTIILEPELHIIEEPQLTPRSTKKTKKKPTKLNESQSPKQKRGARSQHIEEPAAKKRAKGGNKSAEVKSPVKKTRRTKASVTVAETEPKAKRGRGKATTNESLSHTMRTRNNTFRQDKGITESPKAKGRRGTKAGVEKKKQSEVKASPKRTRARQTNTAEVTNTKRRRQSLVITKKAPVMSPKSTDARKRAEPKPESPKRSRSTRQKTAVANPSPVGPPALTRTGRRQPQATEKPKTPSPKKPRKPAKEISKSPEKKPSPPKRSRSALTKTLDVEPPAKRGRNTKNVTIKSPKKTRGKAGETVSAPLRSNRRTKSETEAVAAEPNTRKRKSSEPFTDPVPAKVARTTRGRKTPAESLVVTISPKGKRNVSPMKVPTRGRQQNTTQKNENQIQAPRSTRRAGKVDDKQTKRSPAKKRKQASQSPAKKIKESPVKKVVKAKASPVKKAKASQVKKVISSPAKKIKASPVKKAKAAPAKKAKGASAIKAKTSPAKKLKASPVKKTSPVKTKQSPDKKAKVSPVKKAKASPAKNSKESPAKKTKASAKEVKKSSNAKNLKASSKVNISPVKKTRGVQKAAAVASPPSKRKRAVAASPAKAASSTRSRRR